jgi:PAS domain S-box-containing protein
MASNLGDQLGAGEPVKGERRPIEVKFEGLLEAAPDAILVVDADGVIHVANRQAEVLFGYQRSELVNRRIEMLVPDRVRDAHPTFRAGYFASPVARPMGAGLTLSARRKDGSEFPVDISLSSLDTEDGRLVSAAVRDVTERIRIEAERAELENRLKQAQHNEERARLEAQLHQAQRMESVGQLAGGIAHDFNNLLAGIMNYTALIAMGLREVAQERDMGEVPALLTALADVEEVTKVTKRAAALTHQLLIFSRREVVEPDVLDLNACVLELEKLLVRTIGENIDLRTTLAGELPNVKADRAQVDQVLMNLAVNARDAMPVGGMLEIATATDVLDDNQAARLGLSAGDYVRLSVSDSGSGMTREVRSRAFEPFFTTKPSGSGTGLGLATVYGIVTQADGNVTIYSEPGLGTSVRVYLPVTVEEPVRRVRHKEVAPPGRRETVLLVEDEDIVRDPVRRMLARQGYTVLAAADPDEAMGVARAHPGHIDLLLTDVVMPKRSGSDLAGELRSWSPDTKVLFMSGYSQSVTVEGGVLEPGVNLIEKPFSVDSLLGRLRDLLDTPPAPVR